MTNDSDSTIKLTFLGGAGTVTGSLILVEYGRTKFLVDCGMYQGLPEIEDLNWEGFDFAVNTIDFVLLTHAHLDHCGRLPLLGKYGFQGQVYCTSATADLTEIILKDSAKIQEEDATYEVKKWEREKSEHGPGRVREVRLDTDKPYRAGRWRLRPLYEMHDAEAILKRFERVRYGKEFKPADNVHVMYRDAGHILGSGTVQVRFPAIPSPKNGGPQGSKGGTDGGYTIVFTGDLGKMDQPIIRDPTQVPGCDLLIMESTYGNRIHKDPEEYRTRLSKVIRKTHEMGGRVLIPSFAVGRTQTLIHILKGLLGAGAIPHMPVFLDSPMAMRATEVYLKHEECYDQDTLALLASGDDPLWFPEMQLARTQTESIAINKINEPCIIISSAGMCNGGRVRHHLKRILERKDSAIVFVGYQAEGTLGRQIVDREPVVDVLGKRYHVRASIVSINTLSAHADQAELLWFIEGMEQTRRPHQIVLNHGEPQASQILKKWVEAEYLCPVSIASRGLQLSIDTDGKVSIDQSTVPMEY